MNKLFKRIKKTSEASIKDPEIITAAATPTITKTGLICKIVYIISQIIDNFKKNK
jgi:pantothenate kinase type III